MNSAYETEDDRYAPEGVIRDIECIRESEADAQSACAHDWRGPSVLTNGLWYACRKCGLTRVDSPQLLPPSSTCHGEGSV